MTGTPSRSGRLATRQHLPILERDPFLAELTAALGTGCVALVAGEAGIGKTTLLHLFTGRLPAGTRV